MSDNYDRQLSESLKKTWSDIFCKMGKDMRITPLYNYRPSKDEDFSLEKRIDAFMRIGNEELLVDMVKNTKHMKKDKWYWFLLYIFGRRCHQPYGDRGFYCYHLVGKRCLRNNKKCRYKKNRLESI